MNGTTPHYLLFAESRSHDSPDAPGRRGRWRFVLEAIDGSERFEAADEEPDAAGPRLELLAVVRGLEALDQPSRVTLVTASTYVSRGVRHGMAQWRENDWMWERFGKMTPVKDSDLWRRIDQALQYHQVECRTWRFGNSSAERGMRSAEREEVAPRSAPRTPRSALLRRPAAACRRLLEAGRRLLDESVQRSSSPLTTSGNLR